MLLGFLLGILVTLIFFVYFAPFVPPIPFLQTVHSNLPTIQAAGSIAVACSALVAFFVYRSTVKRNIYEDERRASEKYLSESISLIEKSFSIFTDSGANISPPINDRLTWLSTARMIIRFKSMKSKIKIAEHSAIADEHEEYWRLRYYTLLRDNRENFTLSYLQPSGDRYGRDTISRKSIAIIFDFARWRKENVDPLDSIDDKGLLAAKAVPIDFSEIERFLEQYEEYWAEVLKLREQKSTGS